MSEIVISVKNLTKKYANNKGVFGVNLSVHKGEIHGFLGPNGAGKTTTIRHLLGMQKSINKGNCFIDGVNCWNDSKIVNTFTGYVPGEIVFPNGGNGWTFIKQMAKFKSLRKLDYARDLVKRFKLDAKVKIKAMSKGMKQKLAIIIAFMNKPKVLILDEPTSGLDPLMQIEFDKLLLEARDGGATILISSHIFSEVEKVCDRATIIKDGKIIETLNISEILHSENKTYKFEFFDNETMNEAYKYLTLNKLNVNTSKASEKQLSVSFNDSKTNNFLKIIQYFKILYLKEIKNTLEKQFAKYYDDTDFNEQSTNENEQA